MGPRPLNAINLGASAVKAAKKNAVKSPAKPPLSTKKTKYKFKGSREIVEYPVEIGDVFNVKLGGTVGWTYAEIIEKRLLKKCVPLLLCLCVYLCVSLSHIHSH